MAGAILSIFTTVIACRIIPDIGLIGKLLRIYEKGEQRFLPRNEMNWLFDYRSNLKWGIKNG